MVLAIVAGAALTLAIPSAAWAEDPVDFGSTPIVDTVGALGGNTDEVIAAIDRAADQSGRQLFVAYVDEFTNPEAADAWANDAAIANNMGTDRQQHGHGGLPPRRGDRGARLLPVGGIRRVALR